MLARFPRHLYQLKYYTFIALRLGLFGGEDSANGRWTRAVKLTLWRFI